MPPSRATSTLIPTSARSRFAGSMLVLLIIATFPLTARSHDPDGSDPAPSFTHEEDTHLAEVGAKLSNPVSDVWALFTQFGITWSDGDVNTGDAQIGGNMIFQPIMPVPLYGEADSRWQLITRPTIPFLFGNSVPKGFNSFDNETGIGDITLPLVVTPPTGDWLLGLGPNFLFPTSSQDPFGRQQWGIGPTGILGYKTQDWIVGVFPQYYFGIGSRGDQGNKRDASYMQLLYFGFYNLPDAWQIGFNPTVAYDNKATKGNKWNVPIGLVVSKTTKVAGKPVKFQFGFEYSVVAQDDFGTRFQVKLNVIPVIASLIKNPIFGGN
jgi:hypothetical protein